MGVRRPISVLVPARGAPTTVDRATARAAMLTTAREAGLSDIARLQFVGSEDHDGVECHRFAAVAS